jgi:hypothetical protein
MSVPPARVPSMTQRRALRRRLATLIGFGALVAGFGCRDFKHTNPFDPEDFGAGITVVGPDTLFTIGASGTYAYKSVPAFVDPTAVWSSSSPNDLYTEGKDTFDVTRAPLYPLTESVGVTVALGETNTLHGAAWVTGAGKTVVLTQRLVRIQLRCPASHTCDTLDAGGAWSAWVDGFDAGGTQILGLDIPTVNPTAGTPIATFVSRDTTIASVKPVGIRSANVTAVRSGTTWLVATRIARLDTLRDSLPLVVR